MKPVLQVVQETNLMTVHQRVEYVSNRSASDDGMR